MSLRRFVGYFFALSVCSTIAFASCIMEHAAPEDSTASFADGPIISLVPVLKKRPAPALLHRPAAPKAVLVARAD